MYNKKKFNFFVILILSTLIFIPFVSAETILDSLTKSIPNIPNINNISNKWSDYFTSVSFAQFLIFVLVFLIVYSISPSVPFIGDKNWVSIGISLVISLLATIWLKREEITTILLSYGALGIVLTAIIPFFAIAAISKRSHEKGYVFLSKILWVAFILILFFRWVTADLREIGNFGKSAIPIIMLISLIMLVWENRFYYLMFKQSIREHRDRLREERMAELTAELERMNTEIMATTDKKVMERLINKYNRKAAELRSLGVDWKDWGKG